MLQRNCILALFSLILCHHVNSRSIPTGRPTTTATSSVPATTISHPTSTTLATPTPHTSTTLATPIPHTQDCTVYIPQGLQASLLESSCIRDGFSDARSSLKQLSLEQPEQPDCSGFEGVWSEIFTQRWKVYYALKRNIELLESVNTSLVNASHSDHICRFKTTVLPFLNRTLTGLCDCSGNVNCGSQEGARTEVFSTPLGEGDLTEYCVVRTIHNTLTSLLRMVAQSRSDVSEGDLRCTVNFEERQQILDVESRVLELEYNQEDCSIPSTSLTCNIQSHFALLQEMPALLRNDTSSPMEREGLADDLENVIPFFRDLLRDQLELEASCSLEPVTNMTAVSNCYIAKLYKSAMRSLQDHIKIQFGCQIDAAIQEEGTITTQPTLSPPKPTTRSLPLKRPS